MHLKWDRGTATGYITRFFALNPANARGKTERNDTLLISGLHIVRIPAHTTDGACPHTNVDELRRYTFPFILDLPNDAEFGYDFEVPFPPGTQVKYLSPPSQLKAKLCL